jgi:hypothetical protein
MEDLKHTNLIVVINGLVPIGIFLDRDPSAELLELCSNCLAFLGDWVDARTEGFHTLIH